MKISKILALKKFETNRLLDAAIESERFGEEQKIKLLSNINDLITNELSVVMQRR